VFFDTTCGIFSSDLLTLEEIEDSENSSTKEGLLNSCSLFEASTFLFDLLEESM
jgi:hypothetical protein